jgi:hypothetical protein
VRLRPRRPALFLALILAACADGVGPDATEGVAVLFAIEVPSTVSAEETAVLQTSFDLVDSYVIEVQDSVTGAILAAATTDVGAGLDQHQLELVLPESSVGLRVLVSVIGFDVAQELYRASAYTTVIAVTGGATPLVLPIRYTGPGLRGAVTDDAGGAVPGLSIVVYDSQGGSVVSTIAAQPDGTYIAINLPTGSYWLQPTPPPSEFVCPVGRNVTVQAGEPVVADFVTSSTPCEIDLLVLSGGDNDYTTAVSTMFGTPGLNTDVFFFTNQTPGLNTLRQYDVVLVFTEGIFDETVAIGNELAQYVEAGGNVVVGSFYWQGRSDSGLITPGWGALEAVDPFIGDVDPLTGSAGATYTANDLNGASIVAHPLTAGLTTLVSVAGYSAGVLSTASATVVASWTDGAPLVGYRVLGAGQRVVGVSLFPGADNPTEVTGDVTILWENAVRWAGEAGGPIP